MPTKHDTGRAAIIAAAIVTIISGVLEIIEKVSRWLL